MRKARGRGKSTREVIPSDRTLRSEGPPTHYLQALAGIDTALQDLNDSLTSAESLAEELAQVNVTRESITTELEENTRSFSLRPPGPTGSVQDRIELFEARSRSQSRDNLAMASGEEDFVQEHDDDGREEYDNHYGPHWQEVTSPPPSRRASRENVEFGSEGAIALEFDKELNSDLHAKVGQLKAELETAAKNLAMGTTKPHTYSHIAGSLRVDTDTGTTNKSSGASNTTNSGHAQVSDSTSRMAAAGIPNEWALFAERVRVLGDECGQEIFEIKTTLSSSPTIRQVKSTLKEIRKSLEKLQRALTQSEDMASRMLCPDRSVLNRVINAYSKDFTQLETITEDMLERLSPSTNQDPSTIALGGLAQSILGAAYAKPIDLPEYDGKSVSEYASFKEKFQYVIAQCNTPEQLWAQHLENSLKEDAQRYIGKKGSWFNKYNELWAHLDHKYANRWNIASEAVQNFFFQPEPEEDRKETVDWFYTMKNNLDSLIRLGLTMEEVGVNLILQRMPEVHAKEVRQALRTAHAGKNNKEKFSIKTLTAVVNDTIAVERVMVPQTAAKSTLNLNIQSTPAGANSSTSFPNNSASFPNQYRGASFPNQYRGRGRFRHRGRGRGRGRGGSSNTLIRCMICPSSSSTGHKATECVHFPTAKSKRDELARQGRCTHCAMNAHPNKACIYPYECRYQGCSVLHRMYLCDKHDTQANNGNT